MEKDEQFYWFRTHSGKHPKDTAFYINFAFVGMTRDAEPYEVDMCSLEYMCFCTREEFEQFIK